MRCYRRSSLRRSESRTDHLINAPTISHRRFLFSSLLPNWDSPSQLIVYFVCARLFVCSRFTQQSSNRYPSTSLVCLASCMPWFSPPTFIPRLHSHAPFMHRICSSPPCYLISYFTSRCPYSLVPLILD